jgi:hypothetical protein
MTGTSKRCSSLSSEPETVEARRESALNILPEPPAERSSRDLPELLETITVQGYPSREKPTKPKKNVIKRCWGGFQVSAK